MSDDLSSTDWPPPITLTKLDAARRQLRTALDLWFADGDPVSIHTLAFAAYEIIHVISKKHRPRGLIFDSDVIKDEYRAEWNILMKAASNFFKHANRDADKTFEFHPSLSDLFIMFSLQGLSYCGDEMNEAYSAFMYWIGLHHPNFFVKEMREQSCEPLHRR